MKIIIEEGKRLNLCFEKFGKIEMFEVEVIKTNPKGDYSCLTEYTYVRLKPITLETLESGEHDLTKIKQCDVI